MKCRRVLNQQHWLWTSCELHHRRTSSTRYGGVRLWSISKRPHALQSDVDPTERLLIVVSVRDSYRTVRGGGPGHGGPQLSIYQSRTNRRTTTDINTNHMRRLANKLSYSINADRLVATDEPNGWSMTHVLYIDVSMAVAGLMRT